MMPLSRFLRKLLPRKLLPRKVLATVRAFGQSRSAIAAVEFALVTPVLILFMGAAAETARYANVSRKLTQLASTQAALLSERTTSDGPVSLNDQTFIQSVAMVIFPQLLKDAASKGTTWSNDISMTMSSVLFTPTPSGCTSSCTYKANVVFSLGPARRLCGQLTSAPDTDAPSTTTLPQDVFTAGSIVVVDVAYTYTPVFAAQYIKPIILKRSAYLQPRYISEVTAGALDCQGY